MKLKLRLDKDSVRELFSKHVEKIAFGLVVACSLFVIYSAFGRETFDKEPADLVKRAGDVQARVERSTTAWLREVPDYPEKARQSRTLTKENLYAYSHPWDPPVFEPPSVRSRPELFPVEQVRGVAGMGSFDMKSTETTRGMGGGSSLKGQRWVVVTGLVPYEEQVKGYQKTYGKVEDYLPEFDGAPHYAYYYVERAEVRNGQPADELEWSPVPRPKETQWATTSPEVVDLGYTVGDNSKLVGSLGPWVNGQWREEVAHLPEIPLASRGGEPDSGGRPKETHGDDFPEFGEPGGRFGERGEVQPEFGTHTMETGEEGPENPEYLLFRFFDFTVEPGRQYVYRARLMVKNPSAREGVEDRYLDERLLEQKKEALAEYRKLMAEYKQLTSTMEKKAKRSQALAAYRKWSYMLSNWCEPTEPVTVPRDERLLAVSVTQPNRKTSPPTAKVMVIKWLETDGTEAYKEFPQLAHGKVANFPNCHFPEISDIKRAEELEFGYEPAPRSRRPRADKKEKEEEEEEDETTRVDYMSETIILDMRGGQRMPGRDRGMKSPGKILMLDPDGRLLVRGEIDDLEEYEDRTVGEGKVIEGGFEGPDFEGHEFEGFDGGRGHFEGFE